MKTPFLGLSVNYNRLAFGNRLFGLAFTELEKPEKGIEHMSAKFFETSFGHKIPIDDQYRRNLPSVANKANPENASSIQESGGGKAPAESEYGIVSDVYQFAMMADWIDRSVIGDRRFDRMLDIGGSSGLMGQLFKSVEIGRAHV